MPATQATPSTPTLLSYADKAQDAQYAALSKGSDYFFAAAGKATAALQKAPHAPDAIARAARPLVKAVGTPTDVMTYAKASTTRLSAALARFQDRLIAMIDQSPLQAFARRSDPRTGGEPQP